MKRKLCLLIIMVHSIFFAQAPLLSWQKTLGGTSFDQANAICVTSDGGYIIAGETFSNDGEVSFNHGSYDMWVVKLSASGTIEWQKSFGGSSDDIADSIIQANDGNYIVAGYTFSNNGDVNGNHGSSDCWIIKLNATGDIIWQKTYGGTSIDNTRKIIQTNDNGFIAVGHSSSSDGNITGNHGNNDFLVLKLDDNGNLQWQKSLGGTSLDMARSVQQLTDGYLVAGWTSSNDGDVTGLHGTDSDYWVVKLDLNGNLLWQKTLGGTSLEYAYSIAKTNDGGSIVAGMSSSNDGDVTDNHDTDYWVVKLDASGNIQWQKCYGGGDIDSARDVIEANGGYIITGRSSANTGDVTENHGGWDFWTIKIDVSGNLVWQKSFGGTANEEPISIRATPDGGYAVSGYTFSNNGDVTGNHGMSDCWVIKLGADPSLEVSENNTDNLIKTFPNPTADFVEISSTGKIKTVTLFDESGKLVMNKSYPGNKISIAEYASGMYIMKIIFEDGKSKIIKVVKE